MTTPIEKAAEAMRTMPFQPRTYTTRDVARAALTAALGSVEETARVLCGSTGASYHGPVPCDEHHLAAEVLHAHLLAEPETKEGG